LSLVVFINTLIPVPVTIIKRIFASSLRSSFSSFASFSRAFTTSFRAAIVHTYIIIFAIVLIYPTFLEFT
jgi:hypothetical protein